MPRILNYKSYYEAFKQGVVDDGYTPVTRLLFFPFFDPNSDVVLYDETGELYEADNKKSYAWCNGTEPIPQIIQNAIGTNDSLEILIDYFSSAVFRKTIVDAKIDEMLEAMLELLRDCDLSESKKRNLWKYYRATDPYEFLARFFQRAVLGNNKVTSTKKKKKAADSDNESVVEFNQLVRKKKPVTQVPETVQPPELNYVMQLYAVFGKTSGKIIEKAEDLDALNYREEFEHHRKNYYMAETVCRETRDSIRPDEMSPIEELKDEMEEGIYETRRKSYTDPLKKVNAVMEQASKVEIASWVDEATNKWIGPSEKKGVCHILVNDERFKWVEE